MQTLKILLAALVWLAATGATAGTIDFNGFTHGNITYKAGMPDIQPPINGDGRNVMITTTGIAQQGVAAYHTEFGGAGGCTSLGMGDVDPDLCTDDGRVLILQALGSGNDGTSFGTPGDAGPLFPNANITIMFDQPVRLESILLIDVNGNANHTL